jgi:hypothetical protein
MNIIQVFLTQSLNVEESRLLPVVEQKITDCPFSKSLEGKTHLFLQGDVSVVDDLWKFSVSLNVPHQLLFDSFRLHQALKLNSTQL